MGAGKTTLARALAHATGAKHLRSDVLRKQLAGLAEDTKGREAFGAGLYSCEKTKQTYEELFNVTAEAIDRKGSVVVDASFAQENERKRFMTLAGQKNYPVWLVHLECPDEVTLRRLDQRVDDSSDGRRELFAHQKAVFSEIPPSSEVVKIDTRNPVDYNVQSLLCRALTTQEQSS